MGPRYLPSGLALVSFLIVTSGRGNEPPLEETLRVRWAEAYNSGDIGALSGMYASNARLQEGYCPVVEGREAIVEYWRSDLRDGDIETHLEVHDSVAVEGLMYVSGRYSVKFVANRDEHHSMGGTYTQVWQRDASSHWAIVRETWANLACAKIRVRPDTDEAEITAARALGESDRTGVTRSDAEALRPRSFGS